MREIIADRVELDGLTMLANKRRILDETAKNWKSGVEAIQAGMNGQTGTQPMAASATIDDGMGITNRSPITNNYYNVPAPTPAPTATPTPSPNAPSPPLVSGISPWWVAIPTAIALAAVTWALWPKTPAAQPSTPQPGFDYRITPGTW